MSLNWECSNCPAYITARKAYDDAVEAAQKGGIQHVPTPEWTTFQSLRDAMVYATLLTGFPTKTWGITEDNWEEMFTRFSIVETIYGACRGRAGKDTFFTVDEVKSMIGLTTNAGTKTDRQFDASIAKHLRREARDRFISATK